MRTSTPPITVEDCTVSITTSDEAKRTMDAKPASAQDGSIHVGLKEASTSTQSGRNRAPELDRTEPNMTHT